jgi:YegS/Rv2252/BmrU family lipid kinase
MAIRKAALLYNPHSGPRHKRGLKDIEAVQRVFRGAGIETVAAATRPGSEVQQQTRQAIADGYDTIFACGGDGTIHGVLQGMVGTHATLGVIPMGTANAMAHDLGIPFSPVGAAKAALASEPCRIAVGKLEYQDMLGNQNSRYFTVAAGVGLDAHLFYKLNMLVKGRLGMLAYYAKATHVWLTHGMTFFDVELSNDRETETRKHMVSELLAVRIRQFGGVLREVAPGASLGRNDLRLVLFQTNNRLHYLMYILRGLVGSSWDVPGIELAFADHVTCAASAEGDGRIFVEADGELVGTLPAEISIVPDALTILVRNKLGGRR